jgi:acetyl-CoA carboxylase biotin carboxyl carrier protein
VVPGDQVSEGDTLFIIEAMKTMNPVRAPLTGTVKRVLASNETPVEFGEVLAIIE